MSAILYDKLTVDGLRNREPGNNRHKLICNDFPGLN